MLFLRSLLFNTAWYLNLILHMLLQAPWYFFLSHKRALNVPKRWATTTHWLHRLLAGTKMEVIGQENLLTTGCVIASKHQSVWEFYTINAFLKDGAFILKSELMKIPFFGWYVGKLKHIPIIRGKKGLAMRRMLKVAKERIEEDRQILIFPEGTRKAPGAETDYRYGVTRMYLDLNCPVIPIALNSGLYWPRRKFVRYPGTIRAKILEPIMPGLSGPEFSAELERRIEEACDELYWMSSQDEICPPLSDAVKKRIAIHEERIKNHS